MPISFPSSPTTGDLYTYGLKTYRWTSAFWSAVASEYTGFNSTKLDLRDAIQAKSVAVPLEAPFADYPGYVYDIVTGGTSAPAAFVSGNWTATAGDTEIVVNITALPSDGGSAITALQYRLNGGTAVNFTGTGTGSRTITGLTNTTSYDVEIRAVNAVGNGGWSDIKFRTPVSGATAPSAFVSGNWTATAGDTEIVVNITALPSDGGSAITALQYRLNGGTAVNFTGTGTGSRTITGLTNTTAYDVEIRAVNAIGNAAWSDIKTRTPAAAANIVATLMSGTPFGFAIVPGDSSITKCYVETTGASATTLCTDLDEIGTIEYVPTGTYITYPTGTKPVFHSSGGDIWIQVQDGGKLFYEQSSYTGAGNMLMAMAGYRTVQTGAPCILGVTNGTDQWWSSNARAGILLAGIGIETLRGFSGTSMDDFAIIDGQNFVIISNVGSTAWNTEGWRDGTGTTNNYTDDTWADKGNWNVNRAVFAGAVDETDEFVGRIYGAIICRVDTTTGNINDLATYFGAFAGLTI